MDLKYFFRSVDEHPEPVQTKIEGRVPEWLEGALVRVGPGKFDLGDFTMNHWFDGFAIVYNFIIEEGKIAFRSKYLQSDAYSRANEVKRPVYTEFGTKAYPDPCRSIFSRIFTTLVPTDLTDNDVINVFQLCHGREVYCATESCHVRRVDPITLDTLEKVDMNKLAGINVSSAHPHVGPDGSGYNVGSSFVTGLKYHVLKMPPPSKEDMNSEGPHAYRETSILGNVGPRWKTNFSYYHSFGMSQNYIVFIEQPLIINSIKLATIRIKGRSYQDCLEWRPEEKCKFVVIDKTTGSQTKISYMSDAFFLFHHINAYEDDGFLVIDVITYQDIDVIEMYSLCNLRDKPYTGTSPPMAQRFVLPLGAKATESPSSINLVTLNTSATATKQNDGTIHLTPHSLAEPGFELPQINYKQHNGRKYNYVYGSGCFEPGFFHNAVCKVNVNTKETIIWRTCDDSFPGEAVFVTRPGATEEDDGILLAVVVDRRPDASDFLLILDAKTLKEIARAVVPIKVPALLHGTFVTKT